MARRSRAPKRPLTADTIHNSTLVQQVINKIMLDGKKSVAESITYGALGIVTEKSGGDPVDALKSSIEAITPRLEVRSRRVGGATYQVPIRCAWRRPTKPSRTIAGNRRSRLDTRLCSATIIR